jgi:hypothetical protein
MVVRSLRLGPCLELGIEKQANMHFEPQGSILKSYFSKLKVVAVLQSQLGTPWRSSLPWSAPAAITKSAWGVCSHPTRYQ